MSLNRTHGEWLPSKSDCLLVTGAGGFIGPRVVNSLASKGFEHIRCFVRPSSDRDGLERVKDAYPACHVEVVTGTLLSRSDCERAVDGATVVYHLATGRGKSFPACFQNSVVATRNLVDALLTEQRLERLVNVSSFAVYSNYDRPKGAMLDETCPEESRLDKRCDAYVYAKRKQDDLIKSYAARHGLPYVTVRPSVVFGPGRKGVPGVVGLDTFGFFMHLGGKNKVPLTYVDNCAEGIVLAGLVKGVDGRVFNIVDDDLPSSRMFLKQYKQHVRGIRSIYIPYSVFLIFCKAWERYSVKSEGQLPAYFNPRFCAFHWRRTCYSNDKIKNELNWKPAISMKDALSHYFQFQKNEGV